MDGNQNSIVTLPALAPVADSISRPFVPKAGHSQETIDSPKTVYTPPTETPGKKSQDSSTVTLKQELRWVTEPVWVLRRKVRHERHHSHGTSSKSSHSRKSQQHFPLESRYARRQPIASPPALKPLVWSNWPLTGAGAGISNIASTDLWWAQISNSLAALSSRSYHLHVASGFLTCISEELLLLFEAQRLNTDGKRVYDEVIRGLRERRLNWDFLRGSDGIAELRISWQMAAKREELERFGEFLKKQVHKLERELHGQAETDFKDDEETAINSPINYDDSAEEVSMSPRSSFDRSSPAESDTMPVDNEIEPFITLTEPPSSASPVSPVSSTMKSVEHAAPLLNWADEVIEANKIESQPIDSCCTVAEADVEDILSNADSTNLTHQLECLAPKGSTSSTNLVLEVDANASQKSSPKASLKTWAEVAALPLKNTAATDGWPALSGNSWAWERDWMV